MKIQEVKATEGKKEILGEVFSKPNTQPQYIQGEWKVTHDRQGTNILDKNDEIIAGLYQRRNSGEEEANAQRIVTCVNEYESLKKKEAMYDELIIGLRKIMNGAMANLDSGKKLDKVYTAIEQLLKQAEQK